MRCEHGCAIAPSTFYDNLSRRPSRRARRDEDLKRLITSERQSSKFVRLLGARKMWLRLRGKGHDVARCTVERLMRELGITGAQRAKKPPRTTVPDVKAARPADLVDRDFTATRPNQLWCADFSYVPTWQGMVYVAFVFDVFSRRILGWRAATSMTTDLVMDTLDMALWTRARHGQHDVSGLVHHTDAGAQGTSIAFTERLLEAGVDAAVGPVGDAYDNALAESQIGLYKTELINPDGPVARPRARRDRNPGLGVLVQQPAPARVGRQSNPGPGRTTSLHSPNRPRRGQLNTKPSLRTRRCGSATVAPSLPDVPVDATGVAQASQGVREDWVVQAHPDHEPAPQHRQRPARQREQSLASSGCGWLRAGGGVWRSVGLGRDPRSLHAGRLGFGGAGPPLQLVAFWMWR